MPIAHVNGTSLHYHEAGSGAPIIMIHPPLITSAIFRYQQVQLSDEFRIITFDVRGHGYSAHSAEPVTYPLIVSDMIALLDYLQLPHAYVCGYSAGGSIALEALLEAPSRFLGGVVACGMSEVRDWGLRARIFAAEKLSLPLFFHLLNLSFSYGNSDMGLTFKNLFRHASHGSIDNIRQYFGYSLRYNCTDRLHYIESPLLVMYGEHDKRFAQYAELILNRLPHAKRAVIRDAVHYLFTKDADKTNKVLRAWFRNAEEQLQDKPRPYKAEAPPLMPSGDVQEPAQPNA
jgi:pimeloyl-ACP methyl ester carboxylesterase